jgi:hypothetical protein
MDKWKLEIDCSVEGLPEALSDVIAALVQMSDRAVVPSDIHCQAASWAWELRRCSGDE